MSARPRHPTPPPPAAPNRSAAAAYAPAPATHAGRGLDFDPGRSRSRRSRPPGSAAPMLRVDDLVAPNANPIMRAAGPLLHAARPPARRAVARVVREPDGAGRRRRSNSSRRISARPAFPSSRRTAPNTSSAPPPTTSSSTSRPRIGTSGPSTACSAASSASASAACASSRSSSTLSVDPLVNYPLLELQHACLALGFQGMLPHLRGRARRRCSRSSATCTNCCAGCARRSSRDLSPRWQGQALAADAQPRCASRSGWSPSVAAALLFALVRDAAHLAQRRRRSGRRR